VARFLFISIIRGTIKKAITKRASVTLKIHFVSITKLTIRIIGLNSTKRTVKNNELSTRLMATASRTFRFFRFHPDSKPATSKALRREARRIIWSSDIG
jgi:hypothetical protein